MAYEFNKVFSTDGNVRAVDGTIRTAQVVIRRADTLNMYTIKNPMRANTWYRAYLKKSARLVTVKCLGVTSEGLRFADSEQNVYTPNDFFFWKSSAEN